MNVPDMVSALAQKGDNYTNPYSETRERAAQKKGRQKAEVGSIDVSFSIEAIDNNWIRVRNRLDKELLCDYTMPVPAWDGWTVTVEFLGLEDMNENLEKVRDKIERIINDKRR